jgi:hypothetical protein
MGQITLRGMEPEMEREIRKMAKESGRSLNRVILDVLAKATGFDRGKKRPRADSLRAMAGGWNQKEADEFYESIKSCEQIDREMWQ